MKKQILISLLIIGLVGGFMGAGSFSALNDTETSEGNTFTAGTLDLKVDDEDNPGLTHFEIENMAPGDTENHYWILKNTGTICGQPSVEFANIVNYENGQNEPEAEVDTTDGDPGEGDGELGGFLYTLMKWRQDDGPWHEILMVPNGHTFINHLTGPYGLGENSGDPIPELCENEEVEILIRLWWHPRSDDNEAQSDSVEFDVIFHLDQA